MHERRVTPHNESPICVGANGEDSLHMDAREVALRGEKRASTWMHTVQYQLLVVLHEVFREGPSGAKVDEGDAVGGGVEQEVAPVRIRLWDTRRRRRTDVQIRTNRHRQ